MATDSIKLIEVFKQNLFFSLEYFNTQYKLLAAVFRNARRWFQQPHAHMVQMVKSQALVGPPWQQNTSEDGVDMFMVGVFRRVLTSPESQPRRTIEHK